MKQHHPIEIIAKELFQLNGIQANDQAIRALEATKPKVTTLRNLYKEDSCSVDYGDQYLRAAYMLAYFPHYIEQVHFLLGDLPQSVKDSLFGGETIRVSAFGCGPCPELLGAASFIGEHYPDLKKINAFLMDIYNKDWEKCLNMCKGPLSKEYWDGEINTYPLKCDLLQPCASCEKESNYHCGHYVPTSTLYIAQNCFNDVSVKSEQVLNKIVNTFRKAEKGSVLLVLDLDFKTIKDMMNRLQTVLVEENLGEILVPFSDTALRHDPAFSYPAYIKAHLFTGEDKLIPKTHTMYHQLAAIRC